MMENMSITTTTHHEVELHAQGLDTIVATWLGSLTSDNTRDAYGRDLDAFAGWCANSGLAMDQVQPHHLDAYREHLIELGRKASTVARHLAALSSFYRYATRVAYDNGHTAYRSPLGDGLVRRPKVSTTSDVLGLNLDEVRAILEAAQGSPRDYALVRLLVDNGLRVSEALSIRLEDLTAQRGRMVAKVLAKGGHVHSVVLASATAKAVAALADGREAGYLFATRTGHHLDRAEGWKAIKRLAAAAGLDPTAVHPHAFRHTFVTLSLEAGVPLPQVQRDARHADPRTTQGYNDAMRSLENPTSDVVAALVG